MFKSYRSLQEVQADLSTGAISCLELTQGYLKNIEEKKHLNAFLETFDTTAIEQAKKVDAKIAANEAGRLAGMVIGIKDNICYKDHHVSASSKILKGFKSLYNATVVERLLAEDAIIIGRLNCDEFAMGSSNEKSAYGAVLNPHNEKCVPGGSSGGSAAAVAADLCLATLGSDTGGSIRQPAAFCGVVGLKPTYGRISRWGLIAYGSSLDQIGPMTHSVQDAALLLEIMAGADGYDSTASKTEVPAMGELSVSTAPKRIAYIKEAIENEHIDAEIKELTLSYIQKLKDEGHTVEEVSLPLLDKLVPTYYVISNAEASSNLSRYDGVHYGYRSENAHDVTSTYVDSRSEGFGQEVKRRIMLGTFVLSAGYYDAYYTKAQKVRRLIQDQTKAIFSEYDFMLTPTTPNPAFEFGAKSGDPVAMYLEDIFTVHANLAGVPSISLPLGKHSSNLPLGIQLTANKFEEKALLEFANNLMEKA
ncbi:MAG: Asp-tRNA(Asn)/Glu-tRNA(Gln) amidotransferase GatCAB subunit A [Crocinitomicaceae bacterium]|nr:Asp-tRNA(Asn)/Glu-tRNA(Gln) amidotransferase GatCAB subunit A [Crocinitomicaceae bacterium]|tara:strand:- start:6991 stop:8418 length:1428 start_codon:yes stop_codon:yes gene_type:complete